MIKAIIKDNFLLSQKSVDCTNMDIDLIQDLKDTLKSESHRCVGIAANMIGVNKRMMIINDNGKFLIIINPKVLSTSSSFYESEEGCLCHDGEKVVKRYQKIKIEYLDENFKKKIKTFNGFSAQIVQHELDHFEGILI